ncbi:MAG: class I SAM-dependent methyltransferase [Planctomycetota bacterium]|jgi:SAM-dependent methyltransferase
MSWYETAFRKREYLSLYAHRSDEAAVSEARFAAEALGLPGGGALLLDLACGAGRHARALAGLGHRVVGLDLSRDLLGEAEEVPRVRADMRAPPFLGPFDAATSFFTSFGYFDEAGNRETLQAVAKALRPGGGFLLDFLNAPWVRATLVPESTQERDGATVRIRRSIERGRVLKEVTVSDADEPPRTYTESVRLYLKGELVGMMHAAGLVPRAAYGDFDGRDHTTDAPRCILVADRP